MLAKQLHVAIVSVICSIPLFEKWNLGALPAEAFTTSGLRRALTNAVNAGLAAHELDTLAP